jgi:hypothetical protein
MSLPEIEVMPILINGKRAASITVIYSNGGWKAHVAHHDKSTPLASVLAEGTDLLGPESARQIAVELAEKYRDQEARARRS